MRLIDGASFIDAVRKSGFADEIKDQIIFMAEIQPAIDAEPIVRCKNCAENVGNDKCWLFDLSIYGDHYCGFGRRKDGNDNDQHQ